MAPATDETRIAASDVPDASRWSNASSTTRAGTITIPPPTPKSELKTLSVAFHSRSAADEEAARTRLEAVATRALDQGLRVRWGRKVLEVLPPLDVSKGTAVRLLLEETGLQRALYAGDDTTDLNGFDALDGLDAAVRVAVVSAEGPALLGERADVVVGSTGAFLELLRRL